MSSPLSPIPAKPNLEKLHHLRRLSHLWDNSLKIPGINFRVGLEAIVGLLPIGGDILGMIFSTYILVQAVQLGLPKITLLRMVLNILIDGVVGSIPILGDLFDSTWKANTKNVNLLEAHLLSPQSSHQADEWFFMLLLAVVLLVILVLIIICVIIIRLLLKVMGI